MADEKPQNESNESQAEVGESVAPEPNPLVTALLGQFPSDVQHEGEDTAGLPLVRTDVDNVINVLTWLRDNALPKFNFYVVAYKSGNRDWDFTKKTLLFFWFLL